MSNAVSKKGALQSLKLYRLQRCFSLSDDVLDVAISTLEEIQQYRAMEEKLSGITVKEVVEHFIKTVENQTEEDYIKGRILTNKEAEEWEQIKAIGTVSEFRELKEKATPKKIGHCVFYKEMGYGTPWQCPTCGADQTKVEFSCEDEKCTFCWKCGHKLDWSEFVEEKGEEK